MLNYTQTGSGSDLVLVHGWGMSSLVWRSLLPSLQADMRVTCVDLPGHGQSGDSIELDDLDAVCQSLHAVVPTHAVWLAWSLGGLIALAYASRYTFDVKRLILTASTPCFVQRANWPCAMPEALINQFETDLTTNPQVCLQRFIGLQVKDGGHARTGLRALRSTIDAQPPQVRALTAGLRLLRVDLRAELAHIRCPLNLILGKADALVPCQVSSYVLDIKPEVDIHILEHAAHVPFLSHRRDFCALLKSYAG